MNFTTQIESLLTELEEKTARGEYPNIDRPTAEFIYNLIIENQPKNIIEIGAANGYSTIWLGLAAKEVGATVITFEKSDDRYPILLDNIVRAELQPVVTAYNDDAMMALPRVGDEIDFVFIDAQKSQYLDYFKMIEGKLADRALIVADNIISHKDKLQDFIDYVINNPKFSAQTLEIGKGLMLIHKY